MLKPPGKNNSNILTNNKNTPMIVIIKTIMAKKNNVLNNPSSIFIYGVLWVYWRDYTMRSSFII